jgi:hypothetical protein
MEKETTNKKCNALSTFIIVFVSYSVDLADYGTCHFVVDYDFVTLSFDLGHVTTLFVSTICFFKCTAHHHDLRNEQSTVGLELYRGKKRLADSTINFLLFFLYLDCRLVSRHLWHRLEVDCLSFPILYKIIASDMLNISFCIFSRQERKSIRIPGFRHIF